MPLMIQRQLLTKENLKEDLSNLNMADNILGKNNLILFSTKFMNCSLSSLSQIWYTRCSTISIDDFFARILWSGQQDGTLNVWPFRAIGRSENPGGACSNVGGIICPLSPTEARLTDLEKMRENVPPPPVRQPCPSLAQLFLRKKMHLL